MTTLCASGITLMATKLLGNIKLITIKFYDMLRFILRLHFVSFVGWFPLYFDYFLHFFRENYCWHSAILFSAILFHFHSISSVSVSKFLATVGFKLRSFSNTTFYDIYSAMLPSAIGRCCAVFIDQPLSVWHQMICRITHNNE